MDVIHRHHPPRRTALQVPQRQHVMPASRRPRIHGIPPNISIDGMMAVPPVVKKSTHKNAVSSAGQPEKASAVRAASPSPTHSARAQHRTARKAQIALAQQLPEPQQVARTPWYKRLRASGATFAAVVVLALSGYVSFDSWLTNRDVSTQLRQETVAATSASREGRDESDVHPNDVERYAVAPELPRVLSIPSLGVKTRVLGMDVTATNQLRAPNNINDAGWYNGSARPGQPGAVALNGHVSGPTQPGVFKKLQTLKNGDEIILDNGAKQSFRYKVAHVETLPVEKVEMVKYLQVYGDAEKGVNLMTCGGKFNAKTQQYESRTLVYATQVE